MAMLISVAQHFFIAIRVLVGRINHNTIPISSGQCSKRRSSVWTAIIFSIKLLLVFLFYIVELCTVIMWAVAIVSALLLGAASIEAMKNKEFSEKAEIFSSEFKYRFEK